MGLIFTKDYLNQIRLVRMFLLEIIGFIFRGDYYHQPLYIHSLLGINVFFTDQRILLLRADCLKRGIEPQSESTLANLCRT